MDVCLDLNGIEIAWETEEVGRIIIEAAQGKLEAEDLAEWLRARAPE
jgi:death-on-curing protein